MKKRLTLLLGFVCACVSALAQPKSQWMLQNRQTGEYLSDNGSCLWTVEACEGPEIRILNSVTGNYICGNAGALSIGGYDFATKENAGWYTISSGGKLLAIRSSAPVFVETDRVRDYSVQWTFVRIGSDSIPYVMGPDSIHESSFLGERSARALSPTEIVSNYHGERKWTLTRDISAFPQFTAKGNTLVPALYNMALEESLLDIRPEDGTFMAGMLWPQTWTRDVVYSIFFAYSWIMPDIARKTLEKQTLHNPSEALQDTGSGGSYPISTDRVVWALAAWEYYLATGDKDWLKQTYEGLSYTAKKDIHVAYDRNIHLFKGETCSMDWRIHSYPNWFTNANIGESFSSGTNALHYFLYRFLLNAGKETGAPSEETALWAAMCEELRQGINDAFWDDEEGLYKCYLYPEFLGYRPSQRVGVMSNGLAALLGVASGPQVESILNNYPMYAYGGSVLYPSKPDSYAYHNKSVWPVWHTPMMYAAKKNGNHKVAEHLVKTAIRSGALFLTHKENMTYDTGYDGNTALNSDRQLWSVASYLSIVYRILFGLDLTEKGMSFSPMMPEWMGGEMSLAGLKYRDATVNVTVVGKGTEIASLKVNGKTRKASYVLPSDSRGNYDVQIVMKESAGTSRLNLVPAGPGNCWSPVEPTVHFANNTVFWTVEPGYTYRLYGKDTVLDNVHTPLDIRSLPDGYYSLCAVDSKGVESDLSNPVLKCSYSKTCEVGVKDFRESHKDFEISFDVPHTGDYILWFKGANGRGPHDTFCTIRSFFLDGKDTATVILEAFGDWNDCTLSNHILLRNLEAGSHTVTIRFNPEDKGYDNNMSFNNANWNDWIVESMTVAAL